MPNICGSPAGYAEVGVRNVTVHIEAVRNPIVLAGELRAAGAMAGLAIKPRTPLEPYLTLLGHFDTVLIMSVEPGVGGKTFIPKVLNKVRTARRLIDTGHLRLLIEIDGGINIETIRAAAQAGADCFVAGSAVYGTEDPVRAVRQLRHHATGALASS